ncbi:hypothetical protein [Hoeflea ulvae]|uniref:Transcriptional regulator n=1 Tax=Hoeflea ulvae TaxID=2983764 RepID=A0ABT3YL13_9HYPH|nr:hypothetical protein [Hoeflea ulvae]MCY0096435.1 hypothetical protein [Hoeflea ulvae]
MADFVAVIRKAVDNLPENTPENRSRVYDKARAAIRRQLEAINPQPSDEVMTRQLDKLDKAIDEVETEHAEALPAEDDEADALMAELESMVEKSPVLAEPAPQPPEPQPIEPAPASPEAESGSEAEPEPEPETDAPVIPAEVAQPGAASVLPGETGEMDPVQPVAGTRPPDLAGSAHDEAFGLDTAPRRDAGPAPARQDKPSKGGWTILALILVLGAIAYAGWTYKDTLTAMFGSTAVETPLATEETPAETETALATPETPAEEPAAPEETAAPEVPATAAEGDDTKFTQRLNPDGTETDAGPAPGPDVDDTVEGRSVAALTDAGPAEDAVAADTSADAAAAPGDAAAPDAQPLGVAQKMILYEERLGQQSLEVKNGTVVWTLVSEASGDGPDEQVIRGEINNPDTGLSALLTIKRNTDPSLPASHIVEVVFAVPSDFAGGSIDQLQRIAMKQTEADQGNPLVAVPAKITQDFYMVALNDLDEARTFNTDLLRQRNWIDIPVVYANGRQALITLEKGASGTEVFNQALDAWARATPQN